MRTFPDLRFRDLLARCNAAQQALDSDDNEGALQQYQELAREAAKLGIDSAYVAGATAKALDELGRVEEALQFVWAAATKDPLCGLYQDQFSAIVWKLRQALGDPERDAADPSTPRLYALLMEAGEADVSCHVAMARFHAAAGRLEEAERLLEAVTRLAPVSRDAWVARGVVARQACDEALVLACEAAAAEIGTRRPLPFDVKVGTAA